MAITLDHTIVPAHDKVESARFFADLFGVRYEGQMGPFAQVRVNDALSFDFDDRRKEYDTHHYAFHVSDQDFDAIFARVKKAGLKYGDSPFAPENMQVGNWGGGRGVYFRELGGHLLEIRTVSSAEQMRKFRLNGRTAIIRG